MLAVAPAKSKFILESGGYVLFFLSLVLWHTVKILFAKVIKSAPFSTFLVAQRVKCLPIMRETWVQSLGQEDPLEKEMATHSSTLAWKIPWMEELGSLQSMGLQRVRHD